MNRYKIFTTLFLMSLVLSLMIPVTRNVQASNSVTVADIIVMPRNYIFTWGSSGQNIDANNEVICSWNPDPWQVLYWRTYDTDPNAGVNDWNPYVSVAGYYDIYIYIPDYTHSAPITTQAKYYFNGTLLATLDQNQNKCNWVWIGRQWLAVGDGHTFSMPAQTSDNPYRLISGDSLKLVYINTAPTANAQTVSTSEDTARSITLTGSDPNGNALTYGIVSSPAHGSLSGTPPNVTYTPYLNYNGSDTFTFRVHDGYEFSNTATVTVNIAAVNDAPVANSQNVITNENTSVNISLIANDAEGNSLTWYVGVPGHGTLSGTAPNLLYNPAANWDGSDTFTFYVNDGLANSNTATVTVKVIPAADLILSKTVVDLNGAPLYHGDTIRYTITVTNPNSVTATNVIVTDDIPEGLTFVSANPAADLVTDQLEWTVGSLAYNQSWVGSFDASVDLDALAIEDNIALATSDQSNGVSNAAQPGDITPLADIWVTEDVERGWSSITYTITVGNNGLDLAINPRVASNFSPTIFDITWTCVGAGGTICGADSGSGNTLDEMIALLPVNGTATYTVTGTVDVSDRGINMVNVTPPTGTDDPDMRNNQAGYNMYRVTMHFLWRSPKP